MTKLIDGEELNIPEHVAVIMDGNGRWAKKRLMPRGMGHKKGADVLEQICEDANDLGIRYLTVYAFSTENWKRSEEEVSGIMNILRKHLLGCIDRSLKNNMRVRVIGDRTRLDKDLQDTILEVEEKTAHCTGLTFSIAINYGGRDELRRTFGKLAARVLDGTLAPEDITEETISTQLDTAGMPDPDLLIRTSGELRISNYMIWQLAYTEYYFTDCLWPDFNKAELIKAIRYFNGRDRRFGGVKNV